MERFPIMRHVRYYYHRNFQAREGGHKGCDIFAPRGAPVVAVESGRARRAREGRGGRVVYLQGDSGARYFYGHLSEWVSGLFGKRPVQVTAGQVLGYVGNSGNAAGKPTHLHFQLQPSAASWVDPFDYLRRLDPRPYIKGKAADYAVSMAAPYVVSLLLLWAFSRGR